ncbi:MAG: hypothetical protein GY913_20525 [Proteobacteria bacterium]|nr:hypothetical protein [Pseudomonadota bacterium]MCP4919294.1 hypothetical protein [Pseudomonadota bacterium]
MRQTAVVATPLQGPDARDALTEALSSPGAVAELIAPSGAARSGLGAEVASEAPVVLRMTLYGCRDEADVMRALGFALDLPLPGDVAAIGETLRALGTPLVVLDHAGPEVRSAFHTLRAMALSPRWLILTDELLGLGTPFHVDVAGDAVPPESVGGLLAKDLGTIGAAAAQRLVPFADSLLQLAWGGPLLAPLTHADVLLVLHLSRHLPEAEARAIASASAARIAAICGQLPQARSLLDNARDPALSARAQALLDWAGGDILADHGLLAEATLWHREALARFELLGETGLGSRLLVRSGTVLAQRGLRDEAERRLRRARSLQRRSGDLLGLAAGLRGTAEMTLAVGEILPAETILGQAAEVLDDQGSRAAPEEQAVLRVGQAGLAIARGDLGKAEQLLDEAQDRSSRRPLLLAAVARRRADVALRRGRHEQAMDLLAKAIPLLQRCGRRGAAAMAIRLRGDVAAAAGQRAEAAEHYQLAVAEAVRVGDLVAARKSLSHLLTLERTGTDTSRVEDLLAELADIDTELGAPELSDAVRLEA